MLRFFTSNTPSQLFKGNREISNNLPNPEIIFEGETIQDKI